MRRPKVFIGSSSEAIDIAKIIRKQLKDIADVVIWNEAQEFKLGRSVLESLMKAKGRYDFAIMVFNADDTLESRDEIQKVTRDNVIFEFGLFMGWLDRDRTFFIYNSKDNVKIPSDLKGIVTAVYRSRTDNAEADIGEAADEIRQQIKELGPLPDVDMVTNEAGILNRIINTYIYPPYENIESQFADFVNSQNPESVNSMADLVEFSRDLFLYYLYPLLLPREMRAVAMRVYFAYFLGDAVLLKDGVCHTDCTDRNDVNKEEIKGHFVVGLSNPDDPFMEKRWLEGRVLAGYDEEGESLSNCARVFSSGRANYVSNTADTRKINYEVEDEQSVFSAPVEWRLKEGSDPARASVGVLAISSNARFSINEKIRNRTRGLANILGFLFSMYALNNQAKLDSEYKAATCEINPRPVGISRNASEEFVHRVVALRRKIALHFENAFIKRKIHGLEEGKLLVKKAS
jgi:hypothetical protein